MTLYVPLQEDDQSPPSACPLPQCVELMTRIETKLELWEKFFGNGKPGWKQQTDRRISRIERILWVFMGVGICVGYIIEKAIILYSKMPR